MIRDLLAAFPGNRTREEPIQAVRQPDAAPDVASRGLDHWVACLPAVAAPRIIDLAPANSQNLQFVTQRCEAAYGAWSLDDLISASADQLAVVAGVLLWETLDQHEASLVSAVGEQLATTAPGAPVLLMSRERKPELSLGRYAIRGAGYRRTPEPNIKIKSTQQLKATARHWPALRIDRTFLLASGIEECVMVCQPAITE